MSLISFRTLFAAFLGLAGCFAGTSWAQEATLPQDWANAVQWRSIGPANMSGRITSIAVFPGDPSTYWVASASGGLLKTVNNGNDFEHQFDKEATVAIGDVQVAASNKDIVWVGTGENNPRNSVSWGDGVYKSVDGGKTWKNMGLKKSFQIGAIAIHPENPDIVYVGALGRLWGPNEDRGLYKTVDGGKKWEKIHYVDDKTGVIEIRMNPKNPEELIFATYERLRDGFDGNDPVKRYGPGSGIWKTSDGGKTVKKLTAGLPSCNLGRIGLDYFAGDPDYVVAIVESEKIASQPDNAAYLGVRGEDADVGSRITDVTENSPAEKGKLKVNDIVLRVDGEPVMDYNKLLVSIRKHVAGDKIKLEVAREKEIIELTVELSKYPEGNRGGNPFTGTLGGQAENLQDQQGPDGKEYGGIYLSKDGGESWNRINTLNPRPMYYSHIRFDPSDRNNLYVCGTSLYKSKDGGTTFTDDGGSDGIHVDHHALWIDPNDGRHMLLGNDGGLHVTWDRMEHWDHHNHFAIGQFYHAGVDATEDWKVYGGLQDNGSWGGPNRSARDRGPVNTDWVNVGGGDGFLVLVDPNDKDQIYSESQNGGMSRINLRTGERGSMRPRPPRGTRYRFDWKTPFLLSPHNSQIFYTAGNHVFQSLSKGDNLKAISPDITNSSNGAGSALTESPVEAGVLYVGTTDGAIWVTKNGGQSWDPIFSKPQPKNEGAAQESESESGGGEGGGEAAGGGERPQGAGRRAGGGRPGGRRPAGAEAAAVEGAKAAAEGGGESSEEAKGEMKEEKAEAKEEEKKEEKAEDKKESSDLLSGNWQFESEGAQQRGLLAGSKLELKLDAESGKVSGKLVGRRGEYEIEDGKFESDSGKLAFKTTTTRGEINFTAELKDETLSGKAVMGGEIPDVEFKAKRIKDPVDVSTGAMSLMNANAALAGILVGNPTAVLDESCTGRWEGAVESEQIPGGRMPFTIELKADDKGKVTGNVESQMGVLEVVDGVFNAESGKLQFTAGSDEVDFDFNATVKGDAMNGTASAAEADMEVSFNAKRAATEEKPATQENAAEAAPAKPAAEAAPAKTQEPAAAPAATNPLVGSWKGQIIGGPGGGGGGGRPGGAGGGGGGRRGGGFNEINLTFSMSSEGKLTGAMTMPQGEIEMAEVKLNESGKVHFVADNGRFEMVFDGQLTENKLKGSLDFGGNFQAEFEAEKTEGASAAAAGAASAARAPRGQAKKLEELVPGPRWVSALSASKFKAGRVYASLDGHRSDDDAVYMFVSEDYGATWNSIKGNMPDSAGSVRVLREDIVNESILYAGCEFSAWVSVDRGRTWTRFGGLPTVAVHEFAQHPTTGDVVAATHGRSLWVANVTTLRQMTAENIKKPAVLYNPAKVIRWQSEARAGDSGTRRFVGENPPTDARIYYSLGADADTIEMTIHSADGRLVQKYDELTATAGLHSVSWSMREQPGNAGGGGRGQGGGRGFQGGGRFGRQAPPGTYLVTLTVGDEVMKTTLTIQADPDLPADATAAAFEEFEMQGDDDSESENDDWNLKSETGFQEIR